MTAIQTQTKRVGVLKYGLGNVGSMINAFAFYGHDAYLVHDETGLVDADVVVLAGVGNFTTAMAKLTEQGWVERLDRHVLRHDKPVLGVCLGMQLMATRSEEGGGAPGLDWISGEVVALAPQPGYRVPHMGWNVATPVDPALFAGIHQTSFYFMHGYHFQTADSRHVLATTDYGAQTIVSAVRRENIVGVQFHPEKSQGDGLRFLRNFLEVCCP